MCTRWHVYKFELTGRWFAVGEHLHVFDSGADALAWMNGCTSIHHVEPTA